MEHKKFENSNETGPSNIEILLGTLRLLLGTLRYLQELWVVWGTLGSLSYLQVFLGTFWVFPGSFLYVLVLLGSSTLKYL